MYIHWDTLTNTQKLPNITSGHTLWPTNTTAFALTTNTSSPDTQDSTAELEHTLPVLLADVCMAGGLKQFFQWLYEPIELQLVGTTPIIVLPVCSWLVRTHVANIHSHICTFRLSQCNKCASRVSVIYVPASLMQWDIAVIEDS